MDEPIRPKDPLKLYTVLFETEVVFASEHTDRTLVEQDVREELCSDSDFRGEVGEGDIVSIRRVLRGSPLPGDWDDGSVPWGGEGELTIAEHLKDEEEDPDVVRLREARARAEAADRG